MRAPPNMRIVAASGTTRTRYPIYLRCNYNVVNAVVFPAQGPPVIHIRVIGLLPFFKA